MNDSKINKTFQDPSAKKAANTIAPEETKQFEESAEYKYVMQRAERILQQTTIGFGPNDRERLEKAQTETWAKIPSWKNRKPVPQNRARRRFCGCRSDCRNSFAVLI